jgi:rhodanese-related sulfurtransferase
MFALLMGLKTVSPDELNQLVQKHEVTVFDVNSPQSWSQAHVPGAKISIPPITTPLTRPPTKSPTWCFTVRIQCAEKHQTLRSEPSRWVMKM